MRRVHIAIIAAIIGSAVLSWRTESAHAQTVTAFEGARLIVGNESSPIENATLLVDGTKIV